jgi:hypothetical protein
MSRAFSTDPRSPDRAAVRLIIATVLTEVDVIETPGSFVYPSIRDFELARRSPQELGKGPVNEAR